MGLTSKSNSPRPNRVQLDPNDDTVRAAIFGAQVEQFLDGEIGQYLLQRAADEANEAMEQLSTADPEDPKKIREIQNRVKVADLVLSWLREAIVTGDVAQQKLREDA